MVKMTEKTVDPNGAILNARIDAVHVYQEMDGGDTNFALTLIQADSIRCRRTRWTTSIGSALAKSIRDSSHSMRTARQRIPVCRLL